MIRKYENICSKNELKYKKKGTINIEIIKKFYKLIIKVI